MLMPENTGDLLALAPSGLETEIEIIHDGNQPLQERAVGVLDRFLFLARRPLFVILEIGLAPQSKVAEAIEIRLQTFGAVFFDFSRRSSRAASGGRHRTCVRIFNPWRGPILLGGGFSDRDSSHVLRIAIKVMSSFCGCDPTKLRSSSMIRAIMAGAPLAALARTHSTMRSKPNSSPFASSASVTPSV